MYKQDREQYTWHIRIHFQSILLYNYIKYLRFWFQVHIHMINNLLRWCRFYMGIHNLYNYFQSKRFQIQHFHNRYNLFHWYRPYKVPNRVYIWFHIRNNLIYNYNFGLNLLIRYPNRKWYIWHYSSTLYKGTNIGHKQHHLTKVLYYNYHNWYILWGNHIRYKEVYILYIPNHRPTNQDHIYKMVLQ